MQPTRHGTPRSNPSANCKSTDVRWTETPRKNLPCRRTASLPVQLTEKSNFRGYQTQSVSSTSLQLNESTQSKRCTQEKIEPLTSCPYVPGGAEGPSLLDEAAPGWLDGKATTAHEIGAMGHSLRKGRMEYTPREHSNAD